MYKSRFRQEREEAKHERWAMIASLAMFGVLLSEALYFL
jgi:hypothetical protein